VLDYKNVDESGVKHHSHHHHNVGRDRLPDKLPSISEFQEF
jgi:hypothetical protein